MFLLSNTDTRLNETGHLVLFYCLYNLECDYPIISDKNIKNYNLIRLLFIVSDKKRQNYNLKKVNKQKTLHTLWKAQIE